MAQDLRSQGYTVSAALLRREVDVSYIPQSQRLDLSYSDVDPSFAADAVNTFIANYVDTRQGEAEEWYDIRITALEDQIAVAVAEQKGVGEQKSRIDRGAKPHRSNRCADLTGAGGDLQSPDRDQCTVQRDPHRQH